MSAPSAQDEPVDAPEGSPPHQYLAAENVVAAMAHTGRRRLERLGVLRIVLLGILAGGFITAGAAFSVLLVTGIEAPGLKALLAGLGFSTGFFFVILSDAVLFTEANVVLPAVLLHRDGRIGRVARFWALAWVGNLAGALLFGSAIVWAQGFGPDFAAELGKFVDKKMAYAEAGTAVAWLRAVASGVLANWLVGMAAFFSVMGRTIVGKYVPVFLAVSLFVAANLQHSPANMGYFALANALGTGPGWAQALAWNILPAGLGNMLGGFALVAWPFWFVHRSAPAEA
ncbi:MAG: formate/nitrite transporter family protein [Trueperaceae bacterium]|nr:formate/nitrite transporter family protein [Trueperaceae bacterium]